MSRIRAYLAVALMLLSGLSPVSADDLTTPRSTQADQAPSRTAFSWFDGRRISTGWISADLIMEFGSISGAELGLRRAYARAGMVQHQLGHRLWKIRPAERLENVLAELSSRYPRSRFSPVWFTGESERAGMRAFPGGVIVKFGESWSAKEAAHWLTGQGATVVKRLPVEPSVYFLVDSPPGFGALSTADRLSHPEQGITAFPDWWQPRHTH